MMTSLMGVQAQYGRSSKHDEGCRIFQHGNVRHDELHGLRRALETNNLRAFKDYLESSGSGISPYISATVNIPTTWI